jgi:hypothetical protein
MYKASIFWYSMLTWDWHWEFQLWKATWHDSQELDFVKRVQAKRPSWENHNREKHENTQISPNITHKLWTLLASGMPGRSYQAKPGLASGCQVKSSVSMLRAPVLALIIETSAVWSWCRRSFQDICRGLWNSVSFSNFYGFSLYNANCPFLAKTAPCLAFSLRSLDTPSLLKSWQKHYLRTINFFICIIACSDTLNKNFGNEFYFKFSYRNFNYRGESPNTTPNDWWHRGI